MKTAAVICEYNPFHIGHAGMLRTLKTDYGFERIVCFMSGNFVQRGEPAILDKYERVKAALDSGADLVLELPVAFSTASAGDFAASGVRAAVLTGICTHLCFGSEPGYDLARLKEMLRQEDAALTDSHRESLKSLLQQGNSYPKAMAMVSGTKQIPSNARLGIEYLRALEDVNLSNPPEPLALIRQGDPYTEEHPSGNGPASASALRRLILSGNITEAESWLTFSLSGMTFCTPDLLSSLLNDRLLREQDLSAYQDVSRELNDRLLKQKYVPMSFLQRVEANWTKQYTRARVSRALLHIVLGITKEQVQQEKEAGWIRCFRVLGYRRDTRLLKELKLHSTVPVFEKNARFYEAFPEVLYYDQVWHNATGTNTELTRSPVIL